MKKYVLGIITGSIMTFILTISAAIIYNAKDIEYTPSNNEWEVNDVNTAINSIYDIYKDKFDFPTNVYDFKTTIRNDAQLGYTFTEDGKYLVVTGILCNSTNRRFILEGKGNILYQTSRYTPYDPSSMEVTIAVATVDAKVNDYISYNYSSTVMPTLIFKLK